jgi:hypothetical protein
MKKHICLVFGFFFLLDVSLMAQKPKINPFQRVKVPDSIYLKLEEAYKISTGFDSVNAGNNIWNLINSRDLVFKNGLYSFKGQGPHFPRRVFIYNSGKIYIFSSNYVDTVLQEYIESIKSLKLSETDRIKYLKKISIYLQEEMRETYGAEIKR